MGIKLITDSGCDLPKQLLEKYDIDILPIFILEGDKEYRDKIDIMPEKVLEDMKNGVVYKTAQITPEAFMNKFKEYVEKEQTIIYLGLSSGLSGTYESSMLAKIALEEEYPNADINVLDTRSVSGGQGLIVLQVARMIKNNLNKDLILQKTSQLVEHIEHIFTIDDIEFLYRGGRISRAQNIIGGLLGIKPILCVRDGKLEPLEKVRGKSKVLKSIIDAISNIKADTSLKEQTILIIHGNNLDAATKLKNMIMETFQVEDVVINTIGAVIGAHAGPGTLGVFFLKKNI